MRLQTKQPLRFGNRWSASPAHSVAQLHDTYNRARPACQASLRPTPTFTRKARRSTAAAAGAACQQRPFQPDRQRPCCVQHDTTQSTCLRHMALLYPQSAARLSAGLLTCTQMQSLLSTGASPIRTVHSPTQFQGMASSMLQHLVSNMAMVLTCALARCLRTSIPRTLCSRNRCAVGCTER